jgi:hypothetical protein
MSKTDMIRKLAAEEPGLSDTALARRVGCHLSVVRRALDPAAAERQREYNRKYQRERYAARKLAAEGAGP